MQARALSLGILFASQLFLTFSSRADLVTDSPAMLTGVVKAAASKTVLLVLEDGRTEKKVPRELFPKGTDFYPGRIVRVPITGGLLAIASPSEAPKFDRESARDFILRLHEIQEKMPKEKAGHAKTGSTTADETIWKFLGIHTSYAETKRGCSPLSDHGMSFKTRSGDGCQYEDLKCPAGPARRKVEAEYPGKEIFQCNPLLYGPSVCKVTSGTQSCTLSFKAKCAGDIAAKEKNPLGEKMSISLAEYRSCVDRFVMPYVQKNRAEFEKFRKKLESDCKNPVMDPEYCNLAKYDVHLGAVNASVRDQGVHGCVLATDHAMNGALDSGNSASLFTTIGGPLCGGKKLCVRQIACRRGNVIEERFARCRVENCNSAQACLEDRMVAGGSTVKDVKGTSAGQVR